MKLLAVVVLLLMAVPCVGQADSLWASRDSIMVTSADTWKADYRIARDSSTMYVYPLWYGADNIPDYSRPSFDGQMRDRQFRQMAQTFKSLQKPKPWYTWTVGETWDRWLTMLKGWF